MGYDVGTGMMWGQGCWQPPGTWVAANPGSYQSLGNLINNNEPLGGPPGDHGE